MRRLWAVRRSGKQSRYRFNWVRGWGPGEGERVRI